MGPEPEYEESRIVAKVLEHGRAHGVTDEILAAHLAKIPAIRTCAIQMLQSEEKQAEIWRRIDPHVKRLLAENTALILGMTMYMVILGRGAIL